MNVMGDDVTDRTVRPYSNKASQVLKYCPGKVTTGQWRQIHPARTGPSAVSLSISITYRIGTLIDTGYSGPAGSAESSAKRLVLSIPPEGLNTSFASSF